MSQQPALQPITPTEPPAFIEVRSPLSGHLLFRYDPRSQTVEIKPKHGPTERIRLPEVAPKKS